MINNTNSSNSKSQTKKEMILEHKNKMTINRTVDRIEFIKLVLELTNLKPMFEVNKVLTRDTIKSYRSINDCFEKKMLNFFDTLKMFGTCFEYIKSGSTGHTLKISDGNLNNRSTGVHYAAKVVGYTKDKLYGSYDDINRPENVELLMLRILSYFVINDKTPHIVLPITTFNTKLSSFIKMKENKLIDDDKYNEFVEHAKKGHFHNEVSVLISEWADGGDLLDFLRKNYKNLPLKYWVTIFFQILSTLAVIQEEYPEFRHNDLKANNILLQKINSNDDNKNKKKFHFTYELCGEIFNVPDIGYRCKIWDFDFASIGNLVVNKKVEAIWTNKFNLNSEGHRYYDVHFFFNTISTIFLDDFFNKVPNKVCDFINRIVPEKLRNNKKYVSKKGRLLLSYEELKKTRGVFYHTPKEILLKDPFFDKIKPSKYI